MCSPQSYKHICSRDKRAIGRSGSFRSSIVTRKPVFTTEDTGKQFKIRWMKGRLQYLSLVPSRLAFLMISFGFLKNMVPQLLN